MVTLIQLLALLGVIWAAAYLRARVGTALGIAAAILLLLTLQGEFRLFPWLLVGIFAFLFFADDFRKDKITLPIFEKFKQVLPPMNQTEREALEAGDVWWDGQLFRGKPDWKELLNYKMPELTREEEKFLNYQVEKVCKMASDWEISFKHKDLPKAVWDYLKKEGFFALIIPKQYGGKEFSAYAHSCIINKLSSHSGALGVTVMVPNSLGPAELLLEYGTEKQKAYYLPRLARGEDIPCFGLTGPQAGSDAGAIPDSGIVCKGKHDGKTVIGLRMNFNKRYITLAPIATVIGVAFKMYDPQGLLGTNKNIGVTLALIPHDHPGVEVGNRHYPMGQAFMNGPVRGKDVFIPLEWIIGGQEYAGKGWRMLVECLSAGRGISLPSSATASATLAYRVTGAYASVREQFNLPIAKFEGVEEAMARIGAKTYQMEATRILTAGAVDLGAKPSVITAIAKYHMTETARAILNDAMDVHGGRGVIMGEHNYISGSYMSMPISITVEGANILTRNLMIFGQGAIRCHPFVFKEMQAAKNADEQAGLKQFDSLFFRHIGYALSNFIRSLSLGLTFGKIAKKPVADETGKYYQQLTRMSSALALVSDLSMAVLGGELKRKERLSARLGDVLSYLYLSSAVLKYYQDSGRQSLDFPYVEWNLKNNLYLIQSAFYDFFANFKPTWLSVLLKRIIFPYGIQYKRADDRLDYQVVQPMLNNNELRERLSKHVFVGDKTSPVGLVDDAFNKMLAAEPVRQKIKQAIKANKIIKGGDLKAMMDDALKEKILTADEVKKYLEMEQARSQAIQVDDYSKAYLLGDFSPEKAE